MHSSRRKSIKTYRKRIASRKNKTRSKRKYLKFRKMRGGALSYEQFRKEYGDLVNKESEFSLTSNQKDLAENIGKQIEKLIDENKENYDKMLAELPHKDYI